MKDRAAGWSRSDDRPGGRVRAVQAGGYRGARRGAVLLAGLLVAAGCSSTAGKGPSPGAGSLPATVTGAPSPAPVQRSAAGTSTPSPRAVRAPPTAAGPVAPAVARCRGLAITDDGNRQITNGSRAGHLTFRNVDRGACFLAGYPGLALLDPQGRQVPTEVFRSGKSAASRVVLAPGVRVYAGYRFGAAGGGLSCPPPPPTPKMLVTPPDSRESLTVRTTIAPCGSGRSITVGPVRATVPQAQNDVV